MSHAELFFENNKLQMADITYINFNKEFNEQNQKNWVPFEYEGNVYYSVTFQPHRIVKVVSSRMQ